VNFETGKVKINLNNTRPRFETHNSMDGCERRTDRDNIDKHNTETFNMEKEEKKEKR